MLLTIDVGNTEVKLGCFEDGAERLEHTWRASTQPHRTADEYGVLFSQLLATRGVDAGEIDAVAIASVVPKIDPLLDDLCVRYFRATPRFLQPHRQTLMPIATRYPAEVGADLVAAAIGGRERFGAPLIVASFGTATVFVAISPAGEFSGSAIAPGIATSIDALIGRAAKLPQVALEMPEIAIGRDTGEALRSGIVYGFVGQTQALVARMRAEMGVDAKVVATGGLADVVGRQSAVVDAIDPHLSLLGLRSFHRCECR